MCGLCPTRDTSVVENSKEAPVGSGKPQPSRVLDRDKAMLDLKSRKRSANNYLTQIELKIEEAKKNAIAASKRKDKQRAVFAMKIKKMHEQTRNKAIGMIQMLEQTISNLDGAIMDSEVYQALKNGDNVIKELRSQVNINDLEDIYDNIKEHNEVAEFIEKEVVNEQEYMDELDKLEDLENQVSAKDVIQELNDPKLKAPKGKLEENEKKAEAKVEAKAEAEDEEDRVLVPA